MTLRVMYSHAARDDLVEIATYIAEDSPAAAERFLDLAYESIEQLREMPHLGSVKEFSTDLIDPRLSKLRSRPLNQFRNYSVYYFVHTDAIEVVRILHGMRSVDGELQQGHDDRDDL